MTLFHDPAVKFGGQSVGGIRISHVSHIDRDIAVALTATKGKKTLHTIKALKVAKPASAQATAQRYSSMIANDKAGIVARELAAMDDDARGAVWEFFTEAEQGALTMEWPEAA
jgi:RPA family protein